MMGLQWGHRLSAMEISIIENTDVPIACASMGPPPFGDGDGYESGVEAGKSELLQWGHRLSAMEIARRSALSGAPGRLQWGHRLSAMEMA